MRNLVLERLLLAVSCFGVAVIAIQFLFQEAQGVQRDAANPARTFLRANSVAPTFPNPRSWPRQQALLKECDDTLSSPFARLAVPAARERVVASCLELAEAVQASSPTASLPHLIEAQALHLRNAAPERAQAAFVQAQALAPSEGWLAARRLRFGVPIWADLRDAQAMQSALAADVQLIVAIERFRPLLVDIYEKQPKRRDWLLAAMTNASDQDKRRFLVDIRNSRRAALSAVGGVSK